jgi:hypothetical protein
MHTILDIMLLPNSYISLFQTNIFYYPLYITFNLLLYIRKNSIKMYKRVLIDDINLNILLLLFFSFLRLKTYNLNKIFGYLISNKLKEKLALFQDVDCMDYHKKNYLI